MIENKHTEFKREYVDTIKKSIIAFANTEGGVLYIGLKNDGTACGVENIDDCMLKISNAIRDSVKPDISMFVDISTEIIDNKNIIKVNVQRGTARPYYLSCKGIRPEGVYVRQGASNAPASESTILNLIKETAGDNFEEARSINQNLTFTQTEKYFINKNIPFGEQQKKTLKIIGEDNTYTNLALLLSDQCQHTIKFAVFDGDKKINFKDRKEFSGSLLTQLEDAYNYIDMYNQTRSEFEGLNRIDHRAYPIQAVREALLNAIVHREYSFSSSTLISIYDNRIEFISIGGLVKGISKSDIMLGVSVLRNRNLADIFYRLQLIEAYGTGMSKIFEEYMDNDCTPTVEISDNAFKIILPNQNCRIKNKSDLTEKEFAILQAFDTHEFITRSLAQSILNCSQTTANTLLKGLVAKNYIKKVSGGATTKYIKIK